MLFTRRIAINPIHWSPTDQGSGWTLSESNKRAVNTTTSSVIRSHVTLDSLVAGKPYVELDVITKTTDGHIGIADSSASLSGNLGNDAHGWGVRGASGAILNNGNVPYGTAWTTGDILGIAIDVPNRLFFMSLNGTFYNSGNPDAGTGAASPTNTIPASGIYLAADIDGDLRIRATQNYTTNITTFSFIAGG